MDPFSSMSIYLSGIFSNINCVLCVFGAPSFGLLSHSTEPQIAKENVCCLLCFTRFLDSYQHFTFATVFYFFFALHVSDTDPGNNILAARPVSF